MNYSKTPILWEDLQMAGSETSVQGSLFNKVASLTAWRPLTVSKEDWGTGISLWILWNLSENFFAEHLETTSYLIFFLLFADQGSLQPKIVYLVEQCKIMRRNSQTCPIWCSYENQGKTLLSTCGYTCTNFSSGSKRKKENWKTS